MTTIITIDGPAASGKGTLARRLAEHLQYFYLDTGKIYRIIASRAYHKGLNLDDNQDDIVEIARNLANEFDVNMTRNPELLQDHISQIASKIAVLPLVRIAVLDLQRNLANNPPSGFKGSVLDGRDCGTVISPSAKYKFYITADTNTRSQRRFEELQNNNVKTTFEDVYRDMLIRDERDMNRSVSPLRPAEDAVTIDTSKLSQDQAFQAVLKKLN